MRNWSIVSWISKSRSLAEASPVSRPPCNWAAPGGAFPDGLATDADVDWLYGTWNLDVARTLEAQDMTEEERQMAQAFMSAMQMSITFDASGTMRMEAMIFGETQSESGTWTGRRDGELIVIDSVSGDGTAPPETSIMEIDFASRDVFSAREVGSEETMYFSRQP